MGPFWYIIYKSLIANTTEINTNYKLKNKTTNIWACIVSLKELYCTWDPFLFTLGLALGKYIYKCKHGMRANVHSRVIKN